jgi:hypothetical protein
MIWTEDTQAHFRQVALEQASRDESLDCKVVSPHLVVRRAQQYLDFLLNPSAPVIAQLAEKPGRP